MSLSAEEDMTQFETDHFGFFNLRIAMRIRFELLDRLKQTCSPTRNC